MTDAAPDASTIDDGSIVIPYLPRKHFRELHDTEKRWVFVCAHRRAGKKRWRWPIT